MRRQGRTLFLWPHGRKVQDLGPSARSHCAADACHVHMSANGSDTDDFHAHFGIGSIQSGRYVLSIRIGNSARPRCAAPEPFGECLVLDPVLSDS